MGALMGLICLLLLCWFASIIVIVIYKSTHESARIKAMRFMPNLLPADTGQRWTPNRDLRQVTDEELGARAEAIKTLFVDTWQAYRQHAFGFDELLPLTNGTLNWLGAGLSATLIDALDMLYMLDMTEDITTSREYIANSFHPSYNDQQLSFFEANIRIVGGLLSAHHQSGGDMLYLEKAIEVGELLLNAFDDTTNLPHSKVILSEGRPSKSALPQLYILAESGTLLLEFNELSRLSGRSIFATKAAACMKALEKWRTPEGLYPLRMKTEAEASAATEYEISVGALGDSFYEYLLKAYIHDGQRNEWLKDSYLNATDAMIEHLLQRSIPSGMLYLTQKKMKRRSKGKTMNEKIDGNDDDSASSVLLEDYSRMDHLSCFAGGMLALGGSIFGRADHLQYAKELAQTCYQMYVRTPSGLAPEYVQFYHGRDFEVPLAAESFQGRPEVLETLWILHQLTGEHIYREWAWEITANIIRHAQYHGVACAVTSVMRTPFLCLDATPSYILAETLKYAWLLQLPPSTSQANKWNLTHWVFNTEGHPFPIEASRLHERLPAPISN
jgi:hypothetical protein